MADQKPEKTGTADKPSTSPGMTSGFLFRPGEEELEEVYSTETDTKKKNKTKSAETEDGSPGEPSAREDLPKERRSRLEKKSSSVDVKSESPPSSSSDTWKKFNELKGKITRTVEGKMSEIKIGSGSGSGTTPAYNRFLNSKENSSVSDSEDTSESSKFSEPWKEPEELTLAVVSHLDTFPKSSSENLTNDAFGSLDKEKSSELRHRLIIQPDAEKVTAIKISTAKSVIDSGDSWTGEVESGIEADESFELDNNNQSESMTTGSTFDMILDYDDNGITSQTVRDMVYRTVAGNRNFIFILAGLVFYLFIPLSGFMKGFFTGVFSLAFLYQGYQNLGFLYGERERASSLVQKTPFRKPDYEKKAPLVVPASTRPKGIWFNEYPHEYDPEMYSVTQTLPVYLELKDAILTLSRPKGKINKRASYDEPEYKMRFIGQRVYNIKDCFVLLMPEGLTRKRQFSKKYPIVIMLRRNSLISSKGKDKFLLDETPEGDETDPENSDVYETPLEQESTYGITYLNLFARCDREKEEWYRKLVAASKQNSSLDKESRKDSKMTNEEDAGKASEEESEANGEPSTPFEDISFDDDFITQEEYLRYMSDFARIATGVSLGPDKSREGSTGSATGQVDCLNALINRILFDVFRSPYWLQFIQERTQRKLSSIRLPYYIENIDVTELDLGKVGPKFHRLSEPLIDERGLWFDVDLTFDGHVKVSAQTQLNLMKLQKGMEHQEAEDQPDVTPDKLKSPMYDSDLEDSAESSEEADDEDDVSMSSSIETIPELSGKAVRGRRSSQKFLRIVENVAQSKYFKSVAQSKYVQRAIAGVSQTKLKLTLEIKGIVGTLAINIPPPPSDRLWYGFRTMPEVWLSANPQIGEKVLKFTHIKNFLEKRIMQEFKKAFVLPNMDEFILPTLPANSYPKTFTSVAPDTVTLH